MCCVCPAAIQSVSVAPLQCRMWTPCYQSLLVSNSVELQSPIWQFATWLFESLQSQCGEKASHLMFQTAKWWTQRCTWEIIGRIWWEAIYRERICNGTEEQKRANKGQGQPGVVQSISSNNSLPYMHSTGVNNGSTWIELELCTSWSPLGCLSMCLSVCVSPSAHMLLVEIRRSVSPWYMNYITKVDRELFQTQRTTAQSVLAPSKLNTMDGHKGAQTARPSKFLLLCYSLIFYSHTWLENEEYQKHLILC